MTVLLRRASISWRWRPRWTHTTNTGGWRRGAQWGQPSCTCSASKSSSSLVPSIADIFAGPIPLSISLKARSTLGRLKLLIPKGVERTDNTISRTGKVRRILECPLRISIWFLSNIHHKEGLLWNGIIEWRQWRRLRRCKLDYKKGKIKQFTLDPWSWTSVA